MRWLSGFTSILSTPRGLPPVIAPNLTSGEMPGHPVSFTSSRTTLSPRGTGLDSSLKSDSVPRVGATIPSGRTTILPIILPILLSIFLSSVTSIDLHSTSNPPSSLSVTIPPVLPKRCIPLSVPSFPCNSLDSPPRISCSWPLVLMISSIAWAVSCRSDLSAKLRPTSTSPPRIAAPGSMSSRNPAPATHSKSAISIPSNSVLAKVHLYLFWSRASRHNLPLIGSWSSIALPTSRSRPTPRGHSP